MTKKEKQKPKKKATKIKTKKLIQLEELSWSELEKLDKNKTVVFLPISPLEEHGPHLPVGTDYLISRDAATEAIKSINKKNPDINCILHPPVPLGYCKFNSDFPGSISVSSKTIKDIVYGIGSSLAEHEFKYMMICTYHMGIQHLKGIYSAIKKLQAKYNIKISEPWGPYFYNGEVEKHEPKLGFDTSKEKHAGFRETSLMKYQYPYLVDDSYKNLQSIYRDLTSPKVLGKKFKQLGLKDGYVGSPAKADANYGRWFFTETVKAYIRSVDDLFEGKKQKNLPKNIRNAMKALFWH